MEVGVIADTHGLLRPEALEALRGVDVILHAGDVGHPDVLRDLAELAPLHAVRGNIDEPSASRRRPDLAADWASALPAHVDLKLAGCRIHLRHDLATLPEIDTDIIVVGHSHRACLERRGGALVLNPGSAGPRRFQLPVTLARLVLPGRRVVVRTLLP